MRSLEKKQHAMAKACPKKVSVKAFDNCKASKAASSLLFFHSPYPLLVNAIHVTPWANQTSLLITRKIWCCPSPLMD
jgi:hypothetical protein